MRNPFDPSLQINMAKAGVTLTRTVGWLKPRTSIIAEIAYPDHTSPSHDQLATSLRALLADVKGLGSSATVVINDEWVRYFVVTPPTNTSRLQDCKAATMMRFQSLYGEPISDWRLTADWDASLPFPACAAPHALCGTLEQVAAEHALKLVSITPHFLATWNQWHKQLKPGAWFAVVQGDVLTLGITDAQRLTAIRGITLPPSHDRYWLAEHIQREALRLNLQVPEHLHFWGAAPENWFTDATGTFGCSRLDNDTNGGEKAQTPAKPTLEKPAPAESEASE